MKEKKKWYKKWWVWLVIIFVLGGIGSALDEGEESKEAVVKEENTSKESELVPYTIFEEKKYDDSNYVRVETEATDEESLRNIVEQVKKENEGLDAVWLWIYKKDNDDLLAKARIPYNNKGRAMVGADSLDYIFEKE